MTLPLQNDDIPVRRQVSRAALASAALLAALTAGCGAVSDDPPAQAKKGSPPVEVGVVVVTPATVGLVTELPGRTEASRVAQVRARVAGILQERVFREGSDVTAGQLLFRIDSAPYRALVTAAQAAIARAEANRMQAKTQADRFKPLVEANAISRQDYDNAVAAQKLSEAELAASRAALQSAEINLGYATVTAPISGRIGRALVTEGALVGQGEPTPLAVVQQINPMYVNFTQPVADALRLRAAIADGTLKRAGGADAAEVRIVLDDGSEHPLPGRLLFSDLSVDPGTGQITLRAEVPNPKGDLLPGMYVRARLAQAAASNAILLPQQAVQRAAQGDSVKVVAPDGSVATRTVKVGPSRNGQWVVLDGLAAGEQVIVDGFQRLQGKGTVKAVPWTPPGAVTGTTGAQPGAAAPVPGPASAARKQ